MTFAEVLPVLTAGKIAKLTGWEYRLRDGNGDIEWRYPGNAWKRYDSSMRRLLLASDREVPDSHHPKCAGVPGFCGDRCRPRMTPERFAEVFDAAISVGYRVAAALAGNNAASVNGRQVRGDDWDRLDAG